MNGSDFYTYCKRTFKRTDKETEFFEAVTDTIREMRRRIPMDEDEVETTSTDTISGLGDYRINVETNQGLEVAAVRVIDGTSSYPLERKTKAQFDQLYPNPGATDVTKSKPIHYCIFGGVVYLGPVPDKTSYSYKFSYAADDYADITSATSSVPFTTKYREIVKFGSLARFYAMLPGGEANAAKFGGLFESNLGMIAERQRRNKDSVTMIKYQGV